MTNKTDSKAIQKRIRINKEKILEQLRRTPIVQVACSQVGIGRASYYRWRKEDKEFAKVADEALYEGKLFVNDIAESQLISAIKDKNMTAIIYWLKHNHPDYKTRVELTTKSQPREELTQEEEKTITVALKKSGLITEGKKEGDDSE